MLSSHTSVARMPPPAQTKLLWYLPNPELTFAWFLRQRTAPFNPMCACWIFNDQRVPRSTGVMDKLATGIIVTALSDSALLDQAWPTIA